MVWTKSTCSCGFALPHARVGTHANDGRVQLGAPVRAHRPSDKAWRAVKRSAVSGLALAYIAILATAASVTPALSASESAGLVGTAGQTFPLLPLFFSVVMATLLMLISSNQLMPTRPLGHSWRRERQSNTPPLLHTTHRDSSTSGSSVETDRTDRDAGPQPTDNDPMAALMAHLNHDLRTPLNAIIGFSDIMQKELLGPLGSDRYQTYAGHIRESGLSLLKAVEDTLAMTSLLATRDAMPAIVSLDESMREACERVAEKARGRDIEIRVAPESGAHVTGHAHALRQTLINVLMSTVADTSPGTTISISTMVSETGAAVLITSERDSRLAPTASDPIAGLQDEITKILIGLSGGGLEVNTRADRQHYTRIAYPIARDTASAPSRRASII